MFENFNNLNTISNESDDFHGRVARDTKQEVYFINLLDEASPGRAAGGPVWHIINDNDI